MKEYDVMVIGSGSGLSLVYKALSANMKVALVAREYVGGTCLNVGCVPSKTLLYPADAVLQVREAKRIGVDADIKSIDFAGIMKRMRETRKEGTDFLRKDLAESENLDFYEAEGKFVGEYTVEVAGERIRAPRIFIASGARPAIPPISGLSGLPFLTNETVLELDRLPASIIIIGGSYIGAEYAHFFSAMGSNVTIVEYNERLVSFEEPEVSAALGKAFGARMNLYLNHEAVSAARDAEEFVLTIRDRKDGKENRIRSREILVAAGRKSNADRSDPGKTGAKLSPAGFIEVDEYLQTSKPGIWALGDATGKGMFTHAAEYEVGIAWHNANHDDKKKMDFGIIPHAVFTVPQIASIGLTEAEARRSYKILVGKASYSDIVQGNVRLEEEGFAKAIVEKETERILGFHIIGPEASTLIQEVTNVVALGGSYKIITDAMHIFPSMPELIPEALNRLEERG